MDMSKKKIEPKIWIRGVVKFLGILLILTCFYTLWNAEYLGGKHFLQNFPGNFIAYGRYYWKAILLVTILIFAAVCLVRKIFSMENGRKKEWMIRLVFFLVLLASIGVVFQDFLLGNRYYIFGDIGSDTYQQYYPYYLNCVNRIREGSFSIWNWNYGMGTSLLNNISQTLDPFGLFIIFGGVLLGAEKVKYLLLAAQVLKIIIAALLGRSFLKIFGFSEQACCMGGYLYGFNGYLMLWGQHYLLGASSIYVMLILICLEKLIRKRNIKWQVLSAVAITAALFYSYYNTYMILAFSAIYFLFRIFTPGELDTWKERFGLAGRCILSVVTGVMMSAVVLLPAAKYLTVSSSRLDSETSLISRFLGTLFSLPDSQIIPQTFSRLMSNNLLYITNVSVKGWQNYYEMPNLCYTIFIYLLAGLFLAYMIKHRKEKKKFVYYCVIVIAALLLLLNPGIAMAFNGFTYAAYRYTFVLMPMAALLFAFVWDYCIAGRDFSFAGLLFGILLSAGAIFCSYRVADTGMKRYSVIYAAFIGLALLLFICVRIRKQLLKSTLIYFSVLLAASTMMESYITNNVRVTFNKGEERLKFEAGEISNDTIEALEYIADIDDTFYRVEKEYFDLSVLADSLVEEYSTTTNYNSTCNRNLKAYYEHLYPSSYFDFAINYCRLNSKEDLQALSIANVKYMLTHEPIEKEGMELLQQVGSVYIYRNINTDSVAKWYQKTITKQEYKEMQEGREEVLNTHLIVKEKDQLKEELIPGTCDVGTFRLENDTTLKGSTKSTEKGLLMLAIPDQQGWSIYVDGKKTETFNADYGFLGIELEAGQHEIEARYEIPYLKEGMVISLVGIALLAGMVLYGYVASRRKMSYND